MTELARGKDRCYLVYAIAPEGVTARAANELLNDYIEDRRRGFVIFHDHFTGSRTAALPSSTSGPRRRLTSSTITVRSPVGTWPSTR